MLRRSLDGGDTWGAPETIFEGDIDYYALVFDGAAATVHLMLQEGSDTLHFMSDDFGASWSKPAVLAMELPPGVTLVPAVGHGIVLGAALCAPGACLDAGRLLLPFVCTNNSAGEVSLSAGFAAGCNSCHSCVVYSDDHGVSWHLGGLGQTGSREAQLAQLLSPLSSSLLYANERNMGATPGHRMVSIDGWGHGFPSFSVSFTQTKTSSLHILGMVGPL